MKILVYETPQHNKNYFALTQAFTKLGHKAEHFDWQSYLFINEEASLLNRVYDRIFYDWVSRKINNELVNKLKKNKYDLMVVVRGDHISAETLKYAKSKIPLVVTWSSDDFSNTLNTTKCILDCFPIYDCIFSPRKHLFDEYINKGAKSVAMLDWYYRPQLLFNIDQIENCNQELNVSFIGAWSKRREKILTPIFDMDLNVWGWGWEKKTDKIFKRKVNINSSLGMEKMMKKFTISKININILTKENRDTTNFRNFEIPAAGAFQISERSEEIQKIFEEDKEIILFSSEEELKSKCEFYLKKDSLRKKISINSYKRLIDGNHSIVDRANQIIKYLYSN